MEAAGRSRKRCAALGLWALSAFEWDALFSAEPQDGRCIESQLPAKLLDVNFIS